MSKSTNFKAKFIVWFQKISIPTPRKVIGNSEGEGVSKAKIFKGKYEAKLECPEAWGVQRKKTFCGEGMDIFWKNTLILHCMMD